ncbi:MAG: hypothetical protein L0L47_03000, partial [Bifidobacterium mongoliense]|nr:hypothetical protein [Bifidobacterium mongoliense]
GGDQRDGDDRDHGHHDDRPPLPATAGSLDRNGAGCAYGRVVNRKSLEGRIRGGCGPGLGEIRHHRRHDAGHNPARLNAAVHIITVALISFDPLGMINSNRERSLAIGRRFIPG